MPGSWLWGVSGAGETEREKRRETDVHVIDVIKALLVAISYVRSDGLPPTCDGLRLIASLLLAAYENRKGLESRHDRVERSGVLPHSGPQNPAQWLCVHHMSGGQGAAFCMFLQAVNKRFVQPAFCMFFQDLYDQDAYVHSTVRP